MADLGEEITAFEQMQTVLEAEHMDRWVLLHNRQLVGSFESFEQAAAEGVRQFGSGPFLIRQVGASPTTLPISVVYAWPNAER